MEWFLTRDKITRLTSCATFCQTECWYMMSNVVVDWPDAIETNLASIQPRTGPVKFARSLAGPLLLLAVEGAELRIERPAQGRLFAEHGRLDETFRLDGKKGNFSGYLPTIRIFLAFSSEISDNIYKIYIPWLPANIWDCPQRRQKFVKISSILDIVGGFMKFQRIFAKSGEYTKDIAKWWLSKANLELSQN